MSKITVTTIAGLTSGGDANKVKIESGDDLQVVSGDLTVDTNTLHVNSSTNRVGIGTTSPNNPLEIAHTGSVGAGGLRIGDPSTIASDTGIYLRTTGDAVIGAAGGDIVFDTNMAVQEDMRITSNGQVNMPRQPCFSARASYTNIPLTTTTQVTLSSERFDVGNNLSGNVFTAPISGKYLFTYIFYFSSLDADHTTLDATIKTSNTQYQQTVKPSAFLNADANFSLTGSMLCDMDANDTFFMNVYVQSGAAQTDIHTDSHVSGVLIC